MTFLKFKIWDYGILQKIYKFIENLNSTENFNQIISLGFEGGHPDHDSLALIVNKFSYANALNSFYVPAYNSRKTIFIPVSVFRPLNSQKKYFSFQEFNIFCWADCLKIAFIYKSERKAFFKVASFYIISINFLKKMYFSDKLNIILLIETISIF